MKKIHVENATGRTMYLLLNPKPQHRLLHIVICDTDPGANTGRAAVPTRYTVNFDVTDPIRQCVVAGQLRFVVVVRMPPPGIILVTRLNTLLDGPDLIILQPEV